MSRIQNKFNEVNNTTTDSLVTRSKSFKHIVNEINIDDDSLNQQNLNKFETLISEPNNIKPKKDFIAQMGDQAMSQDLIKDYKTVKEDSLLQKNVSSSFLKNLNSQKNSKLNAQLINQ